MRTAREVEGDSAKIIVGAFLFDVLHYHTIDNIYGIDGAEIGRRGGAGGGWSKKTEMIGRCFGIVGTLIFRV